MWLDLPKGVLYAHNFKSYFSLPFDKYNNRLTVHACTIAKGSTVYFYWGLIHRPVWHPWVLGWSVNGANLPGQADSRQGITTGLAGETGHRCRSCRTCLTRTVGFITFHINVLGVDTHTYLCCCNNLNDTNNCSLNKSPNIWLIIKSAYRIHIKFCGLKFRVFGWQEISWGINFCGHGNVVGTIIVGINFCGV